MNELARPDDGAVDRFTVVGQLDGRRIQITAATPQAAATAADYWRSLYSGATATWFLRVDVPHNQPVLLLVRWRPAFLGNGERVVHAIPLIPGTPADDHPIAYCRRTLPLAFMEICSPGTGTPCPECLQLATLAHPR